MRNKIYTHESNINDERLSERILATTTNANERENPPPIDWYGTVIIKPDQMTELKPKTEESKEEEEEEEDKKWNAQ